MEEKQTAREKLEQLGRELSRQALGLDQDRLNTKTMTEIYETVYDPGPPVIEDLLYPGAYILAGDSKIGKSFLVSQIAFHVAAGKPFWERNVQPCEVL